MIKCNAKESRCLQIMMPSKILDKSFIKVVFYSFHLNVNFYRKTSPEQLKELTCQNCWLNGFLHFDGLYYEEIYFDIWLVKPWKVKKQQEQIKLWGGETKWRRLGDVANLEARRTFLRGSWRLCTPSLVQ